MEHDTPQRPSLGRLALAALYIGIAGYGGGPAIIGYMQQYFVGKRRWVSEHDFHLGLSLAQLLPGAQAMSVITFLGYQLFGAVGAMLCAVLFITPAAVLMIALSAIYFAYGQVTLAQALFTGLGAVVVALLLNATVIMGRSVIKDAWAVLIAVGALVALRLLPKEVNLFVHVPNVILIILAGAIAGWLIYRRRLELLPVEEEQTASKAVPTPGWFWLTLIIIAVAAIILLAITSHSKATQLFLSMLRVGTFTFGGGYASIPLYQHEAVAQHKWLSVKQFLDGIALGQITPGPVLITATFIGYKVLHVWGAILGTIAVFLPGSLGMFIVAHEHERIRNLRWLRAMVRGVVAAFIGILLNVTLQLAVHSITGWKTAILAAAAAVVLLVWRRDPLWVILGGALVSPCLFRA